jgi:hypothetical protein
LEQRNTDKLWQQDARGAQLVTIRSYNQLDKEISVFRTQMQTTKVS